MEDYKRGSHSVWDCKYHLVWTTKYRYQVLGGDVGQRCRELLREIARREVGELAGGGAGGERGRGRAVAGAASRSRESELGSRDGRV
jgi:hypothetical protein